MTVTAAISNTPVIVLEASATPEETADGRSTLTCTVHDIAGTADYQPGMPIQIVDDVNGYTFSGNINDSTKTNFPPGADLFHTIHCVDGSYIPFKRYYSGPERQNIYAGDFVVDLIDSTLKDEGITANYAVDTDQSVAAWQQGQQNNTTAVNTASGGALQLALAGVPVTKTEKTAANWNAGTLNGTMTNGDILQLNAHPALSFSGVCSSGYGNAYAYYKIWSGSYTIASGDKLCYKVWINSDSPVIQAGVDGICSDGTSIRDYNDGSGAGGYIFDQNGLRAHPNEDLSGFANDQWYSRTIDLTKIAGKSLSYIDVAFEGGNAGTYQAYFYDVWIQNGSGTIVQNLFGNSGVISPALSFPNLSAKVSNVGYANIQLTPVTAYEKTGTRVSAGNSMQNAAIYQSSLISWIATQPAGTGLAVSTSVDGSATFQSASNQTSIANIPLGAPLTSRNVTTKIVMNITGKDPTATPQVTSISWVVNPAYAATQTGTRQKYDTQADWNTGTFSTIGAINAMMATAGGDLMLNSSLRDWDDEATTNQTLFGGGASALQSTIKRAGSLRASPGAVARSRLDFASTWADFILSVDIQVPNANVFVGIEYRTTYWDNLPNTGAYVVDLSTTTLNIGRGTNNNTNTHTTIAPSPFTFSPALNSSEWHTLTIIASGTNHKVYLDGVLYFNVTDATFGAAGNIALRIYNNSGGDQTCYWDNFGVMSTNGVYPGPGTFSGPTWTSPSISLGTFTAGNNLIFWDASTLAGDYFNVQASFNGGAYTDCTNGAPIPGIVIGTHYTGATLQIKVQMQAATAADSPVLHGLTAWVTSQYSSSGNRSSVFLPLAGVGRAGSALVSWQGLQPANTGIFIDTTLDGVTETQVGSGASGSAAIADIFTQADSVVDDFSKNTSINYTSTCKAGGSIGTWTWNTALKRLEVSGGSNAHLLYNSPVIGADVDESFVMDQSDNGGFTFRWQDQSNFYHISIHDASSANHPNTIRLFVTSAGVGTQIDTDYLISFTRGTPHVFRVIMTGSTIIIIMDGNNIAQTVDPNNTITGAGFAGFRNDNTGGGSSAHFYLFRIQYFGQDVTQMQVASRVRFTSTDPTVTPQLNILSMSVRDPSIQSGTLIPQTNYSVLNNNRMTIGSILDDCCRQSGNFWYKVFGNSLAFQKHQATPAPWVLVNTDVLVSGVSVENVSDQYRNSQWANGGIDIIPQPISFVGDGTRQTFDVGYPIDSISSLLLNGTAQTIGIKNVDTGKNWYYAQGQTTIIQDVNSTPLDKTQILSGNYNAQVKITVNVPRQSEITRMSNCDQTTGIIDEGEDMSGLNKQAIILKCKGLLDQQAQDNSILRFQTRHVGLAVGMLLCAFVSPFNVFAGGFLITDVRLLWRTEAVGDGTVTVRPWFSVVGVSGAIVVSWQRFMAQLGKV